MRDASGAAAAFRAWFFIGLGLAQASWELGFVAVLINHCLWIFPIGLALSAVGFALVAPTKQEIARRQRQLDEQGIDASLGSQLTEGDSTG